MIVLGLSYGLCGRLGLIGFNGLNGLIGMIAGLGGLGCRFYSITVRTVFTDIFAAVTALLQVACGKNVKPLLVYVEILPFDQFSHDRHLTSNNTHCSLQLLRRN